MTTNIIRKLAVVLAVATVSLSSAPASAAYNRVFGIHNMTDTTIRYVYIVPPSFKGWGADWLGSDVINSGTIEKFEPSGACIWDMKVVYNNGAEQVKYGVDVCQVSHLDATPQGIKVIN